MASNATAHFLQRLAKRMADFYTAAIKHIQSALANGWKKKNAFNLDLYQVG